MLGGCFFNLLICFMVIKVAMSVPRDNHVQFSRSSSSQESHRHEEIRERSAAGSVQRRVNRLEDNLHEARNRARKRAEIYKGAAASDLRTRKDDEEDEVAVLPSSDLKLRQFVWSKFSMARNIFGAGDPKHEMENYNLTK